MLEIKPEIGAFTSMTPNSTESNSDVSLYFAALPSNNSTLPTFDDSNTALNFSNVFAFAVSEYPVWDILTLDFLVTFSDITVFFSVSGVCAIAWKLANATQVNARFKKIF